MCGRFTLHHTWAEVHAAMSIIPDSDAMRNIAARYNITPTQDVLFVAPGATGENVVMEGRWGLVPADRSDIIIEPDELEAALAVMPDLTALWVRYGAHSGFRLGDCVRVPWNTRKGQEIIWATNKSRGMQDYCVPITEPMEQVLDELEFHRSRLDAPPITLLFNSRGKSWTPRRLSRAFTKALRTIGVEEKSLHDLRGTAATTTRLQASAKRTLQSSWDVA